MARRARRRAAIGAAAARPGLAAAVPPGAAATAAILGLALWSGADTATAAAEGQLQGRSSVIALALAIALPLPLLFVRRRPWAVLLVVAVALLRSATGLRGPISVAQSVIVLIALFAAEAQGTRRDRPGWGVAGGVLLLAGIVACDVTDTGSYAMPPVFAYAHQLSLVLGGVAGGYALRDRRGEAARLEAAVVALRDTEAERLRSGVAAERRRIAAETEEVVAQLLSEVPPLAARAAAATDAEAFAADIARVDRSAHAALAEMRRVLHLLRAPEDDGPREAVAALSTKRGRGIARGRHALAALGPVVLLAVLGAIDAGRLLDGPMKIHVYPWPDPVIIPGPEPGGLWPIVTAALCVLPLAARTRVPLAACAAVCGLLLVRMGPLNHLSTMTATQFYIPAAAAFLGAAHARSVAVATLATAVAIATTVVCMALEEVPYDAFGYSFAVLLPAAAGLGGMLVRGRMATAVRARRARDALLAAQAGAVR